MSFLHNNYGEIDTCTKYRIRLYVIQWLALHIHRINDSEINFTELCIFRFLLHTLFLLHNLLLLLYELEHSTSVFCMPLGSRSLEIPHQYLAWNCSMLKHSWYYVFCSYFADRNPLIITMAVKSHWVLRFFLHRNCSCMRSVRHVSKNEMMCVHLKCDLFEDVLSQIVVYFHDLLIFVALHQIEW